MPRHHSELIADLREKLEPVFNEFPSEVLDAFRTCESLRNIRLTDLSKEEQSRIRTTLRANEATIDDVVEGIVKRATKHNISGILQEQEGSACRRSLVREALRELSRDAKLSGARA